MTRLQKKLFLCGCLTALGCCFVTSAVAAEKGNLPITTTSAEALKLYQEGKSELKYNTEAARKSWRKATELDPNFALAHVQLAFLAQNTTEQFAEIQKAIASRTHASPAEQLVVDWLDNALKGKMIPAIQALNDVLEMYPEDMDFNSEGAFWLQYRGACDRAIPIYESILKRDRSFANAWQGLGDCYIKSGSVSKGLAAMKQYVAQAPNQASSEIRYGETLAKAGQYDRAIAHCKTGLDKDSTAIQGWHCLAQAHALKGEGLRAREEYKRFLDAPGVNPMQHEAVALEWAATYVQEGDYKAADESFTAVATEAHKAALGQFEAEAYRSMALYHEDNSALELLAKADSSLQEHPISGLNRAGERAKLLQTRVMLALRLQDMSMAEAAVKQLGELAAAASMPAAERCHSGATGSLQVAQGKFADAIPYLQEDSDNAFSLQDLVVAYRKTGANKLSRATQDKLAKNPSLSLEQILVNKDSHKQKIQIASK